MFGIEVFSISFAIGVAAGAAGLWVLQHGWGSVLAIYHARANAVKAQADSIYAEISGQVNAIVAPVKADVEKLKSQVAALQPRPLA